MGRVDKWTEEEDKILKDNYEEVGAKGCKELGINRSISAIKVRANSKGLKLVRKPSETPRSLWTATERDILVKYFKKEGIKGVVTRGVSKSPAAICIKAIKLGLY